MESAVADGLKVTAAGNEIKVSGITGDCRVEVYTTSGTLVADRRGNCTVTVGGSGIYLLRIAGKTVRVCIP